MAFDIGLRQLRSLLDLKTGEQLVSISGVNPQSIHGGFNVPDFLFTIWRQKTRGS